MLNGYNLCLETSDLLCHVDTGKLIIELHIVSGYAIEDSIQLILVPVRS